MSQRPRQRHADRLRPHRVTLRTGRTRRPVRGGSGGSEPDPDAHGPDKADSIRPADLPRLPHGGGEFHAVIPDGLALEVKWARRDALSGRTRDALVPHTEACPAVLHSEEGDRRTEDGRPRPVTRQRHGARGPSAGHEAHGSGAGRCGRSGRGPSTRAGRTRCARGTGRAGRPRSARGTGRAGTTGCTGARGPSGAAGATGGTSRARGGARAVGVGGT
jgi:hypothetical protein